MTADLGPIEVFDATSDWTDREISALDLVSWLHTHAQARRVYLRGARIVRSEAESTSVDLTDFRSEAALVLHECTVETPIDLDGAVTGRLEVRGCDLRQGLRLEFARVEGAVLVTEATRIGTPPAVQAVAGDEWASPHNAIIADGLKSAQGLFVTGENTRLAGALRLIGASVGGELNIGVGAQIDADADGKAIDADSLEVAQDLLVRGENTRLAGALNLTGASVGGELNIGVGAQIAADAHGIALDVDNAEIATLAVQRPGTIAGMVDLSNARVRFLRDTPAGWEQVAGGWRLSGITVEALPGTLHDSEGWTIGQRIDWLKKDAARSLRPFMQVAGLYRQAGYYSEARKIAVAGEELVSSPWRRIWAGITVGYGYQPWLAAVWALALVILAWGTISLLGGDELFVPANAEEEAACPVDYPCLNRLVYVTETVLPVVTFGQRDAWRIDTEATYGQLVEGGQYVLDAFGWVLGLLVVAAVSGVVRQE